MLSKPTAANITAPQTDELIRCFASLLDVEAEPALLVHQDGHIAAMNPTARRSLAPLAVGSNLIAQSGAPGKLQSYIGRCATTRGPLPGALEFHAPYDTKPVRWRCSGGTVRPAAPGEPALIILRLKPQQADNQFLTLTGKVNALNAALRRHEQIQAVLGRTLAAKTILLSEVQHRIKNNLQMVLSMLSLARKATDNATAQEVLVDAANRVHAMASVQSLLYETPDLIEVDCAELIALLASTAELACGRDDITVAIDAPSLMLNSDDALSLALIVNELITNALKHAFPAGRPGRVEVKLAHSENHATISVMDNGVEMRHTEAGTGLSLVSALAKKLDGEFNVSHLQPKCFSVAFPLKNKKHVARHIH